MVFAVAVSASSSPASRYSDALLETGYGMSFRGFWFDTKGHKLRRLKRFELEELRRLWAKHADIRLGLFR